MPKKIKKIGVPILGTLLLASCAGGSVRGTAQPTSGPATSAKTSSDALPSDVPRVPKALDTTRFQQDPCSILAPAQLQMFKLPSAGKPRKEPSPYCIWSDFSGPAKMGLSVTIATERDGLAGLYRRHKDFKVFEPLQIEDYPAAIVATALDKRPQGDCDVEFAATDKLSISVKTT